MIYPKEGSYLSPKFDLFYWISLLLILTEVALGISIFGLVKSGVGFPNPIGLKLKLNLFWLIFGRSSLAKVGNYFLISFYQSDSLS